MAVSQAFAKARVPGYRLAAVLARPHQIEALRKKLDPEVPAFSDETEFLAADVSLVVEAAGHQAALSFGPRVLEQGRDFYLMSVGVLADPAARARLLAAAEFGGSRIVIPSGGLAGFDGLRALAQLDLLEVTYTSTKPPHAWRNTPGQAAIRARAANEIVTVFDGNAGDAALQFPKNANLAAAVAIAGIGFERTRVRLVSDPACGENIGSLVARSATSVMELTMSGSAFQNNPKSSQVTGASIVAALINDRTALSYG